ncbi:Phosphoenolpyruvate phosphomutase [Labilithrix luteola]|uniref:phosphoenolpyruvate mutase n=1 Tax=Labilithrix luteola TaxID=1391654 RepID=A0A0K1QD98_9BACT|nr:phosphoenolpyruvate mutase [Labilithrix luteola]AKV03724.1 Phosphoenolpyruvate phosphomutase [Labilithrix luteola]
MVQPVASKKTTRLRQMLEGQGLSFLMEAHNGLSAKIVEEAGFQGIWGSGLSISAALGVRDNNEASWTQVLEVVEFMADATTIPILLDGDTGYGNFNSARRLVRKLEQRGIAGVCMEDKIFPKTNSFLRSTAQPLADIEEFAGKIRAAKEAQTDSDFVVVARVEALIAGHGLEEALKRGEAYRKAGADAILIHSKERHADEILAFKKEWGDRLPLVIVPTKYYRTPTDVFREAGFKIVIWANHAMRSAITAMQATVKQIFQDEHLMNVEERVAPLADVFRLQGENELEQAEKAYLPRGGPVARGIVLAAGQGKELGELVTDRPKCMVPIAGKPILGHIMDAYRSAGVRDLIVVRGFAKKTVDITGATYVDNDAYATTSEVASLACAKASLDGPCVVSYGDVLFKKYVLDELLDAEGDFVVAVDSLPADEASANAAAALAKNEPVRRSDWAICSEPHSRKALFNQVVLKDMTTDPTAAGITGEWTGLLKLSTQGAKFVREILDGMPASELETIKVPDLLRRLVRDGMTVRVVYSRGGWLDIDTIGDVVTGSTFK